jgi:hypothetical protein
LGVGSGDRGANRGDFMGRQVVHHDNVVGLKRRDQHLLDIGEEGLAGHRSIEHHRCGQAIAPQRGDKGCGLPVAERRFGQQAPATRGATVQPGHLGAGTGLVDENQLVGIDEGLRRPPDAAPCGDVRPVLLGGAEGLFLNDSPRRSTADHIAPLLKRTACSAASQVCKAARAMSGWAAMWAAKAVSCAGVNLRGR